jgi:hypothetical protein
MNSASQQWNTMGLLEEASINNDGGVNPRLA